MIRFRCPQCKQPLQHPRAHDKVTCPKCGRHVRVPTPELLSTPYNPPPPPPNRAPTVLGQLNGETEGPVIPTAEVAPAAIELETIPPAPASPPFALDELVEIPHRRRIARGFNPLRFVSPTCLMFALALLPLPFVEIRCNATGQTVASQSPVQAVYGGFSTNAVLENMAKDKFREKTKNLMEFDPQTGQLRTKSVPKTAEEIEKWKSEQIKIERSPLMYGFCLCLAFGFVWGAVVPWRFLRSPMVAVVAGGACALLFVQKTIGFPLEQAIAKSLTRPEASDFEVGLGALIYEGHPTPWFWCCLVLCVLAALSAVADALVGLSNAMTSLVGGD